jgi:lipopolysaccharide transport system ATP-binding protein
VVLDHLGQHLVAFETTISSPEDERIAGFGNQFVCDIDELMLLPGRYRINVLIRDSGELQDFVEAAGFFDVEAGLLRGRPMKARKKISLCMPHRWTSPAEF